MTLEVTPQEAAEGFTRQVTYQRETDCTGCAGSGGDGVRMCGTCNGLGKTRLGGPDCAACAGTGRRVTAPCADCHGTGHTAAMHTLLLRVPPDTDASSTIRVKGKGHQRGGLRGDLHVRLRVTTEPPASEIHLTVPISIGEAVFGGRVPVETPAGRVVLTVPPGSSGGRKLRLRGRGAPSPTGRGDVIAELRIVVPQNLTAEARRHLSAFVALDKSKPRK